jgi:hypothetical protein
MASSSADIERKAESSSLNHMESSIFFAADEPNLGVHICGR